MADDRIQSNSEFANQSATNRNSQEKKYSHQSSEEQLAEQSTDQSLEQAQRFASEARTAVGGYAISSAGDVADGAYHNTESVIEKDNVTDSATRAERIRKQTRLRQRRVVGEQEQAVYSDRAVEDEAVAAKSSKRQESSRQEELAEDEYVTRPFIVRMILWLIRKSLVPLIMITMLVIGLYIGYTLIGNQPKEEVFQWPTWRHLYDLIFAES
ncbi:DNA-directed RNA polymerase subunit beta [Paenibacillus yanchengensis]|uniref:DNA-directed RNA polymerase subunit beta n=1 Tax=Paenibacillus yanchengensis TaxID=2035833 RepID=A0ABW4YMR4_9BACL